jgi:hypothetical protein
MSQAFTTSHQTTAQRMSADIDNYVKRINTHRATANTVEAQACKNADGVTVWNPQQLRRWAHEEELVESCMQSMLDCGSIRSRALMAQYRHACFCRVRAKVARITALIPQTLAQVANSFYVSPKEQNWPVWFISAPNVLATCHASNGPPRELASITESLSS